MVESFQPTLSYFTGADPAQTVHVEGTARTLKAKGRTGLNATSIRTYFEIDRHLLNDPQGSMLIWLMPLETLATAAHQPHIERHEARYTEYTILSDHRELKAWHDARFAMVWSSNWYPQLFVKAFRGTLYMDGYEPMPRVVVAAGHFAFHATQWYQMAFTWNKPANHYALYVNGVLVATGNQFARLAFDACGPSLFLGNPSFAFSEIHFFERAIDSQTLSAIYRRDATSSDPHIDEALRLTYADASPASFQWQADQSWKCALDLQLNDSSTLENFYVQGCLTAPMVTPQGLLVSTPVQSSVDVVVDQTTLRPAETEESIDLDQVYLWTRATFEGDLAVEFEFMPLAPNGLSLLLFNASGMQREDFMRDYALRRSGSMSMVCWENVRNYHWEFHREMDDARNDVASHVLCKNPWLKPLGYKCLTSRVQHDVWHKLQLIAVNGHIMAGIDGRKIFDVRDTAEGHAGPILTCGHVGIRCMLKTKMLFRNLRIHTRSNLE